MQPFADIVYLPRNTNPIPGSSKALTTVPMYPIIQKPCIAIVNKSKLSDAEVQKVLPSIQLQIDRDFEPHWTYGATLHWLPPTRYESFMADGNFISWYLVMLMDIHDTPTKPLGYHTVDTTLNRPVGKVFLESCASYGVPWSKILSATIIGMITNPYMRSIITRNEKPVVLEPALAVLKGPSYKICTIDVSNFAFPLWFNLQHESYGQNPVNNGLTKKYDHLGVSTRPYDVNCGGVYYFNGTDWALLEDVNPLD
jgi:hypothetical protein